MENDELESPLAEPGTPWKAVAFRNLKRRGVQVALTLLGGGLVMLISGLVLAPKPAPRSTDPKYIYCPKCEAESKYDVKLDGEPCMKCREEPVGRLEGREESVKVVGNKSRWRWVHLALSLEALVTLGAVVYLSYRKGCDPGSTYYVFSCPHCGQRLRFRHISLGGLGQCTRCKRPVRFPSEDEAVREEDLIREEEERLAAEMEDEEDDE